jgi:hypothetical protein
VREIQIVTYIATFSHDNGRIMSKGERAGSGGRRKHSCNVTSFLCYPHLRLACSPLCAANAKLRYCNVCTCTCTKRRGFRGGGGGVRHKTLQNLNIISIGRSKFSGRWWGVGWGWETCCINKYFSTNPEQRDLLLPCI